MITYLETGKAKVLENLRIVRGPYLQLGSESSIAIRWATDTPVQGRVWYGESPERLCLVQDETTITCNHVVKLSQLAPDTKYYYAVGTPERLMAVLGKLMLRENRDFHVIQEIEAAFRQYSLLGQTPAGIHVLIAESRYLAAHSPTMRSQAQTYQMAHRLHKGDRLFEDRE